MVGTDPRVVLRQASKRLHLHSAEVLGQPLYGLLVPQAGQLPRLNPDECSLHGYDLQSRQCPSQSLLYARYPKRLKIESG